MVVVCGFKSIHHTQMLYGILINANFPSERHVEKRFILLIHTSQASVLLGCDAASMSDWILIFLANVVSSSLCVTQCSVVHMV